MGEGRAQRAAGGFSELPGGRNPRKEQVVFRSGLEGVQEMCCSKFYSSKLFLVSNVVGVRCHCDPRGPGSPAGHPGSTCRGLHRP